MEPKLEHNALEQDVARLSQEVKELRSKLGAERADESAVREVLRPKIYSQAPSVSAPSVSQPAGDQSVPSPMLPDYLQKESPELKMKVEELISLTLSQGIEKTVEEARRYGPFLLDAYHDALTSKMHQELKNRGLLQ
ncbi:MAG: hypothetical protein Q8P76_01745 [bacterium]|nr:hypothetical protein [bacterium]